MCADIRYTLTQYTCHPNSWPVTQAARRKLPVAFCWGPAIGVGTDPIRVRSKSSHGERELGVRTKRTKRARGKPYLTMPELSASFHIHGMVQTFNQHETHEQGRFLFRP
jgi:hypothetical protein